jgi:phage gpG-like protein
MVNDFEKLNVLAKRLRRNQTRLMRAVAAHAVTFSKQRFNEQAWMDNRTEPWKKRKPGSPRDKGRHLLVDSSRLKNSIKRFRVTRTMATIGTTVPYAKIHNEGGVLNPKVTPKMRGFAWKMHKATKEDKWKGLALTKKETLTIKIPQRQFIGHSQVMNKQIKRVITLQISKLLR